MVDIYEERNIWTAILDMNCDMNYDIGFFSMIRTAIWARNWDRNCDIGTAIFLHDMNCDLSEDWNCGFTFERRIYIFWTAIWARIIGTADLHFLSCYLSLWIIDVGFVESLNKKNKGLRKSAVANTLLCGDQISAVANILQQSGFGRLINCI